ncbi:HlyC/CorC family transporter [Oleomonas cavernae]|uniref:HlyC/CorC family transporter n=1 Tax=Oleomonas cavernae TaxID=2320859 RepID=A0A418WGC1_9PROT|nr:hemolysin family protein [Oleomonas cavernae]RJF89022.1 HlyC/CorC family transporter [Oleomonas cavernae]
MTLDLSILVLLVALNAFLVMAELAVVAAKRARLKRAADAGSESARVALALAADPGKFLSTVQVGITAIGTLSGAFGGQVLAGPLTEQLSRIPALAPYADELAIAIIVIGLTYVTLILGELVPKRLALARAESIATFVARPLRFLAAIGAPAVWFINTSTNLVLKLLPKGSKEPDVTDEEVRILMQEGTATGHFHEAERAIVEMTLRLGDRNVDALMTPRTQIEWLDVEDAPRKTWTKIAESHYSRFPVKKGTSKHVLGFVQVKDLFAQPQTLQGKPVDLAAAIHPALYIPETTPALKALELFRANGSPLALIVDEYGDIQGLVTLTDLLEALIGELEEADTPDTERSVVQREDGSYLIDGGYSLDRLWDVLGVAEPRIEDGDYNTLGGLMMHRLKRIPSAGDHFPFGGFRFEVVDMDGRRVDKVLVSLLPDDDTGT